MNKRKKSTLGLAVLAVIFVYFVFTLVNQQTILNRKSDQLKSAQDKVAQEQKLNTDLNKQKAAMNSDEYTEKIARDELGMVKDGEKVFVDTGK